MFLSTHFRVSHMNSLGQPLFALDRGSGSHCWGPRAGSSQHARPARRLEGSRPRHMADGRLFVRHLKRLLPYKGRNGFGVSSYRHFLTVVRITTSNLHRGFVVVILPGVLRLARLTFPHFTASR